MKTEIEWYEWLRLVRRVGKLEGAIEAHAILTADDRRPSDEILYAITREGDDD
ncbi:MAG TPA: hypothetical protein VIG24_00430 [Acidimicrobiia bacterium]